MKKQFLFIICLFFIKGYAQSQQYNLENNIEVLVVGGGASGTMAGIQSARMGIRTTILEETPWLGGMLTSAGVSAIDGNYGLRSGLWEEFRQELINYYGSPDSLKTGWVSDVLFEPQVGFEILKGMTSAETNLNTIYNSTLKSIEREQEGWIVTYESDGESRKLKTRIVIDATELGDVAAKVGIPYDIGMDSTKETGEEIAPKMANDIIQDLTYVAILKDFGTSADKTIPRPQNYDPNPFLCTCIKTCNEEEKIGRKLWDCDQMMRYGKLPNGYYMINWPINGNDYYANFIEKNKEDRLSEIQLAKEFTLNYVYYLQTELGYKNLGIADDIYPTLDNLPFIPYYRESRRIKGMVRFTLNDLAKPFENNDKPLYKTGIAVGDYPIDHHHYAFPESDELPDLHFYPVPSYSLPLGTLIPKNVDDFIVGEKSISVSNIVNGTTRLQPVCLLIGQAAGTLAALSIKNNMSPRNVSVREVQLELLNDGAYIMPYSDIEIESEAFVPLQKLGACGILKGEGKNIGWKNHTHIYPDKLLSSKELLEGIKEWINIDNLTLKDGLATYGDVKEVMDRFIFKYFPKSEYNKIYKREKKLKNKLGLKKNKKISRASFAIVFNEIVNPFELRGLDINGNFIN
ncbi:MAG: FAD-dependent oxidoreductase [Arenibacter sp.]